MTEAQEGDDRADTVAPIAPLVIVLVPPILLAIALDLVLDPGVPTRRPGLQAPSAPPSTPIPAMKRISSKG